MISANYKKVFYFNFKLTTSLTQIPLLVNKYNFFIILLRKQLHCDWLKAGELIVCL